MKLNTKKMIIFMILAISLFAAGCDMTEVKGRWNPEDPEYDGTTDPEYVESNYKDEYLWDFDSSTDGWAYSGSYGEDGTGGDVPEILAGRVICSQTTDSGTDVLSVEINTDSITNNITWLWIRCNPDGSIDPDPYFSMRIWLSQIMIDSGATSPTFRIWGGDGDAYWEANNISLQPDSAIVDAGWYNFTAQASAGSYETLGTPTFEDMNRIELEFHFTSNPATGTFCLIDYIRLATTADPEI